MKKHTSFFRWISHSSTSWRWKMWWQGKTRTLSPFANSDRQIAHSNWDSNQGWLSRGVTGRDVDASSHGGIRMEVSVGMEGDPYVAAKPSSRWISAETWSGTALASSPPSCFSQPVPVQTLQGRFLTTSSGARSRCAARAARIRWIKRVMKVRADGSKRMTTKVTMGLQDDYQSSPMSVKSTHEYHSHAEYSAVISKESVLRPECVVLEWAIRV